MRRRARVEAERESPRHQHAEPTPLTSGSLLYLYCVLEPGTAGHRLLQKHAVPGLESGEALFPVEAAGLVAAVSRVPVATFREEPLNSLLADLPRLAPLAVRHEEAVRLLLPGVPALVPIAFGAIYEGEERIAHLLRESEDEFRRLLDRVRGRQEWGLKVFEDLERLREAAQTWSEALRGVDEEVAAAGPGRAYLLGKQRERLLAAEARRLAVEAATNIVHRLSALSVAIHREDVSGVATHPARPDAGSKTHSSGLILNAAFLIESSGLSAFHAAIAELRGDCEPLGLRLEMSGPWAPYSFVGTRHGAA